ncbi:hypothetical protein B0H34DRAFT_733423 [Crassisporium funariophilum]|nr:hypothetical protein B0H34DRAFT_733423 [Crassisporium funariophilum]
MTISYDEQQISFADVASAVYSNKDRPFLLGDLTFNQLPRTIQKFLLDTTELYSVTFADPEVYQEMLFKVRKERLERLRRNLAGVHRAIVIEMFKANSNASEEELHGSLYKLKDVLIPEWRSHLDAYVEELDALTWFEIKMGPLHEIQMAVYLEDRKDNIEQMLTLVIQCLLLKNESVKQELGIEGGSMGVSLFQNERMKGATNTH